MHRDPATNMSLLWARRDVLVERPGGEEAAHPSVGARCRAGWAPLPWAGRSAAQQAARACPTCEDLHGKQGNQLTICRGGAGRGSCRRRCCSGACRATASRCSPGRGAHRKFRAESLPRAPSFSALLCAASPTPRCAPARGPRAAGVQGTAHRPRPGPASPQWWRSAAPTGTASSGGAGPSSPPFAPPAATPYARSTAVRQHAPAPAAVGLARGPWRGARAKNRQRARRRRPGHGGAHPRRPHHPGHGGIVGSRRRHPGVTAASRDGLWAAFAAWDKLCCGGPPRLRVRCLRRQRSSAGSNPRCAAGLCRDQLRYGRQPLSCQERIIMPAQRGGGGLP